MFVSTSIFQKGMSVQWDLLVRSVVSFLRGSMARVGQTNLIDISLVISALRSHRFTGSTSEFAVIIFPLQEPKSPLDGVRNLNLLHNVARVIEANAIGVNRGTDDASASFQGVWDKPDTNGLKSAAQEWVH